MQVQCLKIKLKQEKAQLFLDWVKSLNGRLDQVRKALEDETMVVESIFLDEVNGEKYIFFYTRAKDLLKASQVVQASTNTVDVEALTLIAQTWEQAQVLEVLFDLDLIKA